MPSDFCFFKTIQVFAFLRALVTSWMCDTITVFMMSLVRQPMSVTECLRQGGWLFFKHNDTPYGVSFCGMMDTIW